MSNARLFRDAIILNVRYLQESNIKTTNAMKKLSNTCCKQKWGAGEGRGAAEEGTAGIVANGLELTRQVTSRLGFPRTRS